MLRLIMLTAVLTLSAGSAQAQLSKVLKKLGLDEKAALDDDTVISGLKEALQIGTNNAVDTTGQVDGYFKNEAIKILMPDALQKMDSGLRFAGYGPQLDELVLGMNRAAEKAAPFAKDIFWGAIKEMSIRDAQQILKGGDTAATDYFKEATSDELTEAFLPIVQEVMDEVGVSRQYKDLVGHFNAIPFMSMDRFDLDRYVVGKALDGLFHVVGEEERKIRQNPAARVTDLLKKVFS